ncbi:Putative transporter B0361.11 [Caenorhabditis elegans]|uniref:Putative transporter B0361.11 n=1 Tax=Caenorhabditis elegans TaxID=6239 RepID=YMPB_CAEEL|nr:Putative transporter B0361.11 [Caenorhabditis elegans]Q7Z118.2 RecName: Full=Putative transporter B0361.11 [Caenorhabditis elegans]CCD61826.1 Putative transporter B0361.11 [Caenorhabditis elegans]|eukprot:NP_001021124.2 Putative transporter B0361.11 [Caenorhabditis elegans]
MSISRRSYEQFDEMKSENQENNSKKKSSERLKKLDPDKFVEAYGAYGKYQIFTYVLVQTLNFFYSSSMYIMSFVQLNLEKQCEYKNETIPISETCQIETESSKAFGNLNGEYCGIAENTLVNVTNQKASTNLLVDFDLSCSHWFFQEFGLTIFTIGAVIAVPFMSMLADRYGRKPIIVTTAILAFLANMAASFSPNFAIFLILRAFIGACSDSYLSVASVATCEYLSEKARAWITVVYNVAWSLGMVWTLLVTLMTDDWRWRYFIVSLPGVYGFALWYFLPESPHWLITKNKTEKLKKYIKTANRVNNVSPEFNDCQQSSHHEEKHESFKALLGSKKLIWLLFANGFIEMVISLVYFAISFMSVELGGDQVQAFLYSSLIEIPAGLAVIPLMMKMGRKMIVIWCLVFQTLALIGVTVFLDSYEFKLVIMLVAKVMATIIYSVHPIWATEQFPTSVRSLCFSLMNIPQSMGIIMSPYVKHIVMSPNWIPFVVIALFSFISATLAFMLHETKNKKLPTDIESLSYPSETNDLSAYRRSKSSSSSVSALSKTSVRSKKTLSSESVSKKLDTVNFSDKEYRI